MSTGTTELRCVRVCARCVRLMDGHTCGACGCEYHRYMTVDHFIELTVGGYVFPAAEEAAEVLDIIGALGDGPDDDPDEDMWTRRMDEMAMADADRRDPETEGGQ